MLTSWKCAFNMQSMVSGLDALTLLSLYQTISPHFIRTGQLPPLLPFFFSGNIFQAWLTPVELPRILPSNRLPNANFSVLIKKKTHGPSLFNEITTCICCNMTWTRMVTISIRAQKSVKCQPMIRFVTLSLNN